MRRRYCCCKYNSLITANHFYYT
ncbi:MAG: hypothetical protein H0U87_04280 [Acidobacteria bacterium]|nr:hypothetical protein [Acidobacteriota bacterium]